MFSKPNFSTQNSTKKTVKKLPAFLVLSLIFFPLLIAAAYTIYIPANGFLVLRRSETKLVLKNNDEKLFLYDAGGKLVDESGFLGTAPEGKSFSRLRASFAEVATKAEQDYGGQARVGQMSDVKGQMFSWGDPTPGALNKISLDTSIIHNVYPFNVPLNKNLGVVEFWSMMLGTAIVLSALIMFALKRNENLSKLFFGRDEIFWQ